MARGAHGSVLLALLATNAGACMFFRSLDDLTSEPTDAGHDDVSAADTSPPDDGGSGADGRVDAANADANLIVDAPAGDAPTPVLNGFCAQQDPDAGPGGFFRCFDYDEADAAAYDFTTFAGVTMGVEDAGARGNVLTIRLPPLTSQGGTGRQNTGTSFTPKHIALSYSWQIDWVSGQAADHINGPTVYRSDVYAYSYFDLVNKGLYFHEQDQRPSPLVNGAIRAGFGVDLHDWHRVDLVLDLQAGTFEQRVDGVLHLTDALEWPNVSGNADFWIGTPFHYGNQAPMVLRLDDVVIRARP